MATKGVWERAFQALQAPELDWVMLDSTVVRAHQHSAGQKKATHVAQGPGAAQVAHGVATAQFLQ